MEHFFRHHKRTINLSKFSFAVMLLMGFCAIAYSAEQGGSQSSSTNLDFANGLYARKMYGPAITEYEKFLRTYPESVDAAAARFRYADSFYFIKDYASAIANFDVFIKKFPGDKRLELAQLRMGAARYYQGDRRKAARTFLQLYRVAQDKLVKSGALFYLAQYLEQKGKGDRSQRLLERLVKEDSSSEYAIYAGVSIGDYFLASDSYDKAVEGYLIAANNTTSSPISRQARFKIAEILFSQKKYSEAAKFYNKVYDEPVSDEYKDKALVGLFYCDYYSKNLSQAERRLQLNRPRLESNPNKNEILYIMASLYSEEHKYEQSIQTLDELISSKHIELTLKEKAQYKKVAVLSDSGKKDQSLTLLEEYFQSSSKSKDKALYEKAMLLSEIKKYDEAQVAFNQLIKEFPLSTYVKSAIYQSAVTLAKASRMSESRQAFQEYVKRFPDDENSDLARLEIVQVDLDSKNFQQAFEEVDQFIRNRPQSDVLDIGYYKLGIASAALKRFGHASVAFGKIVENYPKSRLYVESLYGMAVSLENARKIDEAIPQYEKLLSQYPEHSVSKSLFPRMGYLYIQNNDTGKALTFYEDLIFNKRDIEIETDGVFWMIQYLLDQKLYDKLNSVLSILEQRFPTNNLKHERLFFSAEAAMGQKDYQKSAQLYEESVAANPQGDFVPQAHLGRGVALTILNKDLEARESFVRALKYDHELKVAMRARFELANMSLKAKQYEEAAKAFMLVAILYDDPKYTPPSLFKAGECFRVLGKQEDAQKAFQELQAKYPSSEWAKKI